MENEAAYAAGLIAASLMGAGYYANRAHAEGVKKRAIALGYLIALPLRLLLSRAFAFFAQVQFLLPATEDRFIAYNNEEAWYTDDFEATWQDVLEGCQGLLKEFMTERGDSNGTKR